MQDVKNNNDVVKEFMEAGAEISGGIAGAVIGGLIAGPAGIIVGGASGPFLSIVLKKMGNEIKQRVLSPREHIRIGAVYTFAVKKFKQT